MNSSISRLGLIALAIALPSCGVDGTGSGNRLLLANHPTGTGPFDSRGNYVEDWADNPANWSRPSAVASNTRTPAARPNLPAEVPVVARHEQPPMNAVPIVASAPPPPRPPAPATASRTSTPATTAAAPKPKPKPKPVVASAPKPATPTRYTIRKGDTLSGIAARHKTSVVALQRANNIKGTLIHPGKVLVIPRS